MIIVDVANAALPTPGASQVNETNRGLLLVRPIPARPYVAFGSMALIKSSLGRSGPF
jgi:hypothetical protein